MHAVESRDKISHLLVQTLISTNSLNEFFEVAMPALAEIFGGSRGMLIDYREGTGQYDLIHFDGYSDRARFELQHRLQDPELKKSLSQREPYRSALNHGVVYIPLYFTEALEAVIAVESDGAIEMTPARYEAATLVSKFVGLLMSSKRLAINRAGLIDFDDLQRARQIQLSYLPAENLATERYEIYGYNQSSAVVGGDYFDYFRLGGKSIQCILADASGHGLSAALIMSTFRAMLHAEVQRQRPFSELFQTLNQSMHSSGGIVQYLTGVFSRL